MCILSALRAGKMHMNYKIEVSFGLASKFLASCADTKKRRLWHEMTARNEDGDRIMEQGQFYLTLDETAQSTNRSDDSPDVYSRGKEAWGPFCPFGHPEQTGPSVESLIAREQHLRIINDAMPCGV